MKFLLMIHGDEREWSALTDQERETTKQQYAAFAQSQRESGTLLHSGHLQPTDRATTVRVRDGETLVTDGPYTETKEALGGYFLLEADSLDEVVDLVRGLPVPATTSGIEIRAVYEEGRAS
ncbi:MAG: YciI family protein [Gaiellaceae bacterium]